MKKTMKTLLALMAGTMALAACSDDAIVENNNPQQPEVARKHITFTAVQEDNGATRAAISSETAPQIVWSADDHITVLYRDVNTSFGFDNVDFSLTGGANTTSGTFDGEVLETVTEETVYTALYPCHTKNEGSRPMTLEDLTEDEQDVYDGCCPPWSGGEFDQEVLDLELEDGLITHEQYDHIMAFVKGETVSVNNSVTLTADGKITDVCLPAVQTATEGSFDPATALMMAQTTGSTDAMEFKNVASYFKFVAPFTCSKVQIFDNAQGGQMAGTLTLTYNAGEPTAEVTANGASSITLTGAIEEGKTYYIATLPQTFSQGIKMYFVKSDGTEYTKSTSSSYTLGRNKVSNMGTPALGDENIINPPYVTFSAASSQTLTMSAAVEGLEYSVGGGAWATLGTSTVEFGGTSNDLRLRGTNGYGTAEDGYNYEYNCSTISFSNATLVECSGDVRTLLDYINYETVSTANASYRLLFNGCTQLVSAPELPATVLTSGCYYKMFQGCTSLTAAPELPATTLSSQCYISMFKDCTSLTAAPELPAENLKTWCYQAMFEGCTNLNYVNAAFTTTPGSGYTRDWLENVASTGTFVKNPDADWDVTGASGVPEGWTIVSE